MSKTDKVQETVLKTIKKNNLTAPGDRLLVGLSGGADSMCLLHVLCSLSEGLGIEVAAMHMNHNIRGEEAEYDAHISESLAKALGISFYLVNEQVREYAKKHSLSEELAGRELRYKSFDKIMKEHGYTKVATAHNKNDCAETILMNFMRGSGILGLCGIPVSRGNVIRPLLDVSREEIERYCEDNKLCYVTDSTNLTTVYTRNKIRLNLIPEIREEFNPNFINTVTSNAEILAEENNYIDKEAQKAYNLVLKDKSLDVEQLNLLHPAIKRRVIMKFMCSAYGSMSDISSVAVMDIIDLCKKNHTGKSVVIPKGYTALIQYGKLLIHPPKAYEDSFCCKLSVGEKTYIPQMNIYMLAEVCSKRDDKNSIYISCNDTLNICVRNRRKGDVFYPTGMSGRKKLKDFFIDKKVPAHERNTVPIITVDNNIAAVYNMRTDRRYEFGENKINLKITIT